MTDDQSPPWLPLGEAAQRLGITVDALRSKVRRRLVDHRKGNDGRIMVAVAGEAPTDQRLVEVAEVERWREVAHRAEVAQARAETERDAAREQLDRELARVARLEEELRELRRPWWRRLIG
jgi:hypothetical protein